MSINPLSTELQLFFNISYLSFSYKYKFISIKYEYTWLSLVVLLCLLFDLELLPFRDVKVAAIVVCYTGMLFTFRSGIGVIICVYCIL